jgi:MT0933-like antitoxin protein
MAFLDKVKNLVAKNADKVDTAIDKAGDLVDKRTRGKYTQHVAKVQGAAKKAVADNANRAGQVPPSATPPSATPPPATPPPVTPPQQEPPTAPPVS